MVIIGLTLRFQILELSFPIEAGYWSVMSDKNALQMPEFIDQVF
jgi:hypothetical protein